MLNNNSGNEGKGKAKGDGGEMNGKSSKMSKPDNWCLPGHNHKWLACPQNPRSNSYSGIHYKKVHHKANAKKKKEKELHIHEKEDKEEISVTGLAFRDGKEEYFDLEHSPTVQRVHPETIIAMPIAPRSKKIKWYMSCWICVPPRC
eukprot:173025-Ditylum_brightwellii.AAC.1